MRGLTGYGLLPCGENLVVFIKKRFSKISYPERIQYRTLIFTGNNYVSVVYLQEVDYC
jgi:hypothetical protein